MRRRAQASNVLRGQQQNGPTTTVLYTAERQFAQNNPGTKSGGSWSRKLDDRRYPTTFVVQGDTNSSGISGLRVQINLTYPNDPDLSATLYYDMGQPGQVSVPLFSGVGSGVKTANFTNTIFDDNATTPIQNGQAPFFATFNPQMPLTAFEGLECQGNMDTGHY